MSFTLWYSAVMAPSAGAMMVWSSATRKMARHSAPMSSTSFSPVRWFAVSSICGVAGIWTAASSGFFSREGLVAAVFPSCFSGDGPVAAASPCFSSEGLAVASAESGFVVEAELGFVVEPEPEVVALSGVFFLKKRMLKTWVYFWERLSRKSRMGVAQAKRAKREALVLFQAGTGEALVHVLCSPGRHDRTGEAGVTGRRDSKRSFLSNYEVPWVLRLLHSWYNPSKSGTPSEVHPGNPFRPQYPCHSRTL